MTAFSRFLSFALALGCVWNPVDANAASPLAQTELYSKIARDCKTVPLDGWAHPTRQVMNKDHVGIEKVELCDSGKYPIFTVHFKFDPRGQTTSFFQPFYARMAAANGYWPFSFVDLDDAIVINVMVTPKHEIEISYEDFTAP